MIKIPELVLPAGNMEKLQTAVLYGADAVYLAGPQFGLRTRAGNFSLNELKMAVYFAQKNSVRVFVVVNAYFHSKEIEKLLTYITYLKTLEISGVVVSDPGAIKIIREESDLSIHLSTQASCLNSEAAKFWKKSGIKRVVLGREVSYQEAALIKAESGLEVELFIHGSMCSSFSGKCVISNFSANRDSNRGGCAHSCRHEYQIKNLNILGDVESKNINNNLIEDEISREKYFMSSKDLMGLETLPEAVFYGIDALKVEGRMKNHLYVGTVAKSYKTALNFLKKEKVEKNDYLSFCFKIKKELESIPHREYGTGGLLGIRDKDLQSSFISSDDQREESDTKIIGIVLTVEDHQSFVMEVKNDFNDSCSLVIVPFEGENINLKEKSYEVYNCLNEGPVFKINPNSVMKIKVTTPLFGKVSKGNIVKLGEKEVLL